MLRAIGRWLTGATLLISAVLFTKDAIAQASQRITVSLTNYAFTPSSVVLKAGTVYRLHLSNSTGKAHDFSAPEFFANAIVPAGDRAKVLNGRIDVDEGESVDITVTPSHPGRYPVSCTYLMHSLLGMTGQIVVQ